MRWQMLTAAALAVAAAAPASAQDGQLRRFTESVSDTNRSNRIVYVPLAMSTPGAKPAEMPYDVAVAAWYQVPLNRMNVSPDQVLDKGEYTLEAIETLAERPGTLRVVVTRRTPEGAEAYRPSWGLPQIEVVHTDTLIQTHALATAEAIPNGVRYTFMVPRPDRGFNTRTRENERTRYEVRLQPARDVKLPRHITRAPTFGGSSTEVRAMMAPPRTTVTERVAGKRQEVRTDRDRRKR